MNSEKDTLPNNQIIFEAIKELQQQLNARIDVLQQDINTRFEQVEKRFEQIDNRDELVRLQMMSFDVQLDRLVGSIFEVKSIAHHTRADVNVMRTEILAWSKEVSDLQLKVV